LANDEIKDGLSERGGYPVERKLMKQWSMRITQFAQRLLAGLDKLEWSDSLKEAQRYWIGKSEGTSLNFKLENFPEKSIEVFTTRPDTIFGVSFLTIAPENELVDVLTTDLQKQEVEKYVSAAKNRSERERQADISKVSGVFSGSYALHPFSGNKIPVWIGDYVLAGYGTGAVMAVPGHDARDYRFAKHFNLPILNVIEGANLDEGAFEEKNGKMTNSDFLNGLEVKEAIKVSIREIEKRELGAGKINFRLRDAVFGRQRYWGEPIPVYYKEGIPYVLSDDELPLILPEIDRYLPTETGEPPLARAKNWKYKGTYEYEHTTMPGWAGSSWYFIRYMDAKNEGSFANEESIKYWNQIDLYLGGSEHATGHLLYFRFWTMALHDLGYLNFEEPAKKLINQGMIQGRSNFVYRINGTNKFVSKGLKNQYETTALHVDVNIVDNDQLDLEAFKKWRDDFLDAEFVLEEGKYICGHEVEKMSKSKWNVISPDSICENFGADTLRLYEMFLGPLELSKPWITNGITGVTGFLKKLWRLFHQNGSFNVSEDTPSKAEFKSLHKAIKKITEDIDRFSFNTSVSTFMICVNELTELKCNKKEILQPLLILISPYAPHITEELFEKLGNNGGVSRSPWPVFNPQFVVEDSFKYLSREEVQKFLNGAQPKKVIIVPKKIVNFVL
jgi:leucyl-tRNA synthetase